MAGHIGIDFDNTIALYDGLFHRCAVERYGMPGHVAVHKAAVRDWFWSRAGGNEPWTELQGIVYGSRLDEAEVAPGLVEFLRACRQRGARASIISHKTEFPARGAQVNLREAARAFLEARGLFDAELGLCPDRLFFAATREEKIARIGEWRCDAFVDDLAEVFSEPAFPKDVRRILYDRTGHRVAGPGVTACASWSQIRELLFPGAP